MTDETAEVIDLWPYLEDDLIDRAFEAKRRQVANRPPRLELVDAALEFIDRNLAEKAATEDNEP